MSEHQSTQPVVPGGVPRVPGGGDDVEISLGGLHQTPPVLQLPQSSQSCTIEPSVMLPVDRASSQLPGARTPRWEIAQEVASGIHQGMSVLGVRQSAARGVPVTRIEELEAMRQMLDQMMAETRRMQASGSTTQAFVSSEPEQPIHVHHQL